jgi:uncharacterized protein
MDRMMSIPLPSPLPAGAPPAYHILAKPSGAVCNLDCAYCFFLSKEMLYPGSRFRMADELLESYLRQLFESHRSPEVYVAWQGGEPTLMGLDFFRRSIEYQKKYCPPGVAIQNTIQTNGVLLDDEWAALFKENNFLVGISIDGPRPMHDAYRRDKGGKGTFERVMRGLGYLQKHGVDYNILTTLHHANISHPQEVYRFLRDGCGGQYIQFIPIVERVNPQPAEGKAAVAEAAPPSARRSWRERPLYVQAGEQVTERSISGEEYGRFLIGVFEEWVRRDVGEVYVQMFDVALANWYGEPAGLCIFSPVCGTALAMEHNGDVYSCDHFVEPAYRLGNIQEQHLIELVASPQQRKFGQDKLDTLPRYCLECPVRFACHGGCPKDRFIRTPSGEAGLNHLCAGYKAFFQHINQPMRIMSELLRRGRAPAEIMYWYAQQDAAAAAARPVEPGKVDPGKKEKRRRRSASQED